MANFGQLILTNAGLNAQYDAQAGKPLKFKRIGMGSGKYTGNIRTLTKLVTENVSVNISKGYKQNEAFVVEGFFSNEGLTTGFAWREIGLFVEDQNGKEILYCYANAGDSYDYIPATEDERYSKYIRIATVIGNATDVSIVESEGIIYVDVLTFREAEERIDISNFAEGDIITLTDSAEGPLVYSKVIGKSEQVKTEGYQLFDASKLTTTSKGGATVTNNGDGSFTISGSGTLSEVCSTEYSISNEEAKNLFKAGKLYMATEKTLYPMFFVNLYKDGSFSQTILSSRWGTSISADLLDEYFEGDTYSFRIGFHGNANETITSGTIKPMLYQDGDGTWEPFSGGNPAPSPQYPQDIIGNGDNGTITVKHYGRNFVNPAKITIGSNDSLEFSDDGYEITVTGSVGYANSKCWFPISFAGKKICIKYDSAEWTNMGTSDTVAQLVYKTGGVTKYLPLTKTTSTQLVKDIPDDATDLYLALCTNNVNTGLTTPATVKIKGLTVCLYEENSDMDWCPYHESIANIPVDASLYEGDYMEVYADGSGKLYRINGDVTFNGSEYWYLYNNDEQGMSFYINIEDSTKGYQISLCDKFKNVDMAWVKTHINEHGIYSDHPDGRNKYFRAPDETVTSLAEWKTWLASNPIRLVYKLATPIVTDLTEEQVAEFKKLYTFEPVTNIFSDGKVKVQYFKNNDNGKVASVLAKGTHSDALTIGDVVDNLESTRTDLPLSANQGRVLKDKTETLETIEGSVATYDACRGNILLYIHNGYIHGHGWLETAKQLQATTGYNVADIGGFLAENGYEFFLPHDYYNFTSLNNGANSNTVIDSTGKLTVQPMGFSIPAGTVIKLSLITPVRKISQ